MQQRKDEDRDDEQERERLGKAAGNDGQHASILPPWLRSHYSIGAGSTSSMSVSNARPSSP